MLAASQIKGPMDRASVAPVPLFVDYLYLVSTRLLGTDPGVNSRVIVPGEPYEIAVSRSPRPNSDPLIIWWELLEQDPDKPANDLYACLTMLHPRKFGHTKIDRAYRSGREKQIVRGSNLLKLLFDLPRHQHERLHLRPKELQGSPDAACFPDANSEEVHFLIGLAEKALSLPT